VLPVWLDAKATAEVELTLAFKFTDVQENYGLQIRRGVAEFWDRLPDHYDFAIITTRVVVDELLAGELKPLRAIAEGKVQIEGDSATARRVLGYFLPGRVVSEAESFASLIRLRHLVGYFLHPSLEAPRLVDR
jgi:alkyl sulfatase BDS1-like metallo-beta-lactamase superfamily hydrolase